MNVKRKMVKASNSWKPLSLGLSRSVKSIQRPSVIRLQRHVAHPLFFLLVVDEVYYVPQHNEPAAFGLYR